MIATKKTPIDHNPAQMSVDREQDPKKTVRRERRDHP
jgi:hypothetical protein